MSDPAYWPGIKVMRKTMQAPGTASADVMSNSDARANVVKLLNQALGIAQSAALRCERQYVAAFRGRSPAVAAAALEHANGLQVHCNMILRRIAELGGRADAPYETAAGGASEPGDPNPLIALMKDHLAADHSTIRNYRGIAGHLGVLDPASQRLIEDIIHGEETCAADLAGLLEGATAPSH